MARRLALFLLACACACLARAHDPFLAEIETTSTADTVVLRVLMTRSVAAHLAGLTANPRLYFAADDFTARQADFDRTAQDLCRVSIDGRPLPAAKAEAALSKDGEEIVFILTYPRPIAKKVRLDCIWLSRLPEGYAASTRRGGEASKLTGENPSGYLHLAPAP